MAPYVRLVGTAQDPDNAMLQNLTSAVSDTVKGSLLAATVVGSLAIISVIGRSAYRRLREQKLCLDTAVDNMSQGLTMFDRSGRLVLCNRRYIEMYGLSAEVIRPGCTVHQVVEHRIETGSLTACEAQGYVNDRQTTLISGKTVSNVFELPNGRDDRRHPAPRCTAAAGSPPMRTSPSGGRRKRRSPTWRITTR